MVKFPSSFLSSEPLFLKNELVNEFVLVCFSFAESLVLYPVSERENQMVASCIQPAADGLAQRSLVCGEG